MTGPTGQSHARTGWRWAVPARPLLALFAIFLLALSAVPLPAPSQAQPDLPLAAPGPVGLPPNGTEDSEHGQFRCGSPFLAEANRVLYQQVPFRPLTLAELQALGRADAAGLVAQDTLGQQRQFWAHRLDTGQPYQLTAVLKRVTAHGYLYVDVLRPISEGALDTLAAEWDKIYTTVTGVFGDIPDVDGDPRVTILILDILDGASSRSGYVAGYFNAQNELPGPNSNLREMVYLDSNPGTPGDQVSLFTLAHEFQHMVNWNYHQSDGGQDTWLNEGLADLAGFLSGYGHDDNLVLYLRDPNDSLINWGNSAKDYGSAYLLLLYLWEHYGGNRLARAAVQHPGLGKEAVDGALAAQGTADRFRQVFQKWAVANYLDDDPPLGSGTPGPYSYQNLNLVDRGEDNRTSFRRAALTGSFSAYPVSQSFTVQRWGVRYFAFGGGSGNLHLAVDGPDGSPFGASMASSATTSFAHGSNQVSHLALNAAQDGSAIVTGFGTTNPAALLVAGSQDDGLGTVGFGIAGRVLAAAPATPTATPGTVTPSPTPTGATPTPTVTSTPVAATPTVSSTAAPGGTATPTATSTAVLPITVAPTLAGPNEGAMLPSMATTLTWANPPGTTQYQIQVVPASNDGPGINLIRNAETGFTVPAPVLGQGPYIMLPGMSYSWRVRATSKRTFAPENDPTWGPWSPLKRFRTPPPNSSGIVALNPSQGAMVPAAPLDLRWADSGPGVFYYEVQVSGDPRFDPNPATATSFVWWNLIHGGVTTPLNSWRTPSLAPNTAYFWRVRPRVQGDGTPVAWSPTFSFRTGSQ